MSNIVTISIPENGQYKLVAPFEIEYIRVHFNDYRLATTKPVIENTLGFKIVGDNVIIPPGIIFSLKIKINVHTDRVELHVFKKYNKGVEPFYLYGKASRFSGIQLEPQ